MSVTGSIPLSGRFPSFDESVFAGAVIQYALEREDSEQETRPQKAFGGERRTSDGDAVKISTDHGGVEGSDGALAPLWNIQICGIIPSSLRRLTAGCKSECVPKITGSPNRRQWAIQRPVCSAGTSGESAVMVAGTSGDQVIVSIRRGSPRINCLRQWGDRFTGFHAGTARLAAFPCRKDSMVQ